MISALILSTMLSVEEPKTIVEKPKIETSRKRGKQQRGRRRGGGGLR